MIAENSGCAGLKIAMDFPNGNHHGVDILPDRIVFRQDQCEKWWGAQFVHVRFDNAPAHAFPIQFLDARHGLDSGINSMLYPCTSVDDIHWTWHRPHWNPAKRLWNVTVVPPKGQSSFYFAIREPYPPKRLDWFCEQFKDDPRLRRGVIGKTVGGREIPFLTLGDETEGGGRKARVFIIATQHATEVDGTFMLEGMLLTLLSNHPRMRKALEKMQVEVVPVVNMDGLTDVRHGGANHNYMNLNREWADAEPEPEVRYIRDHILAAYARNEYYDLFIDSHCAGPDTRTHSPGGSMGWSIPVSVLDYLREYLPGDWTALPLGARHRRRRAVTADRFMLENLRIPSVIYHGGQYLFKPHGLLESLCSAESYRHEGKMAMKAILDFLRLGCGPDVAITCPLAGTIVHGRAEIPVRVITSDDIPFPPPGFSNDSQLPYYLWTGGYEKVQARLDGGTWIDLANSGEFREGEWTGKISSKATSAGPAVVEVRAKLPNDNVVIDSVKIEIA